MELFGDVFFVLLIVLLTLASAFCSSSETALFSLPLSKVKSYSKTKDRTKKLIVKLLESPQDLLVTIFILNTIVNILLQNAISSFLGEDGSYLLKIGVPLLILLFLGEILPKQFGLQKNFLFSEKIASLISFFQQLLGPIRQGFVFITNYTSRFLFFFLKKGEEMTPEELQHVLEKSEEVGVLHPDEAFLAKGVLELKELLVKEVMRPKEEILAFDIQDGLKKLFFLMVEQECTRIPVYQESIDHVLGVITAPKLFLHREEIKQAKDLNPFLERPFFAPENVPAKALLKQLEAMEKEMALVVDEYGVITGLITKEDLIEVVVGAITDRRDDTLYYQVLNATTLIAKGQMEIEDLERFFTVKLSDTISSQSVGGYLTEKFGDIPSNGMTFEEAGLLFRVLSSDPNRVKRIFVQKVK